MDLLKIAKSAIVFYLPGMFPFLSTGFIIPAAAT